MRSERTNACSIVGIHCLRTLPDSFTQRRDLLSSLLQVLPSDHPLRSEVACSLTYLIKHEEANDQLLLGFEAQIKQQLKGQ